MKEKCYICCDLKSFYASVECVERGLDPMTTNLVVADKRRTDKTICLAVSPSLKAYGISGRARLFEVVQKVKEVNLRRQRQAPGRRLTGASWHDRSVQENPSLALDYLVAPPRMAHYIDWSTRIYSIYLKYIAPEDIVPYSIDVFVIGHVNKEGSIAGPKVLEHMVDCVLYFEGEQQNSYRILRAAKNRFGATNEIGVFEMRDSGLVEVENPSEMLLSGRPEDAPGTCVTCVMEGARPVLAEIQALAVSSPAGNPRRTSNGFDYNRFAMLLAVLEKRGGLKVSACDAYLNIIGGLSLDEPAADLAAVIALASSYLDRPVPADLVAIGEVGLTGELRSVSQLGQRVSEVRRLGFTQCLIPSRRTGELAAPAGLRLIPVRNIGEAIRAALRPSE